MSTLPRQAPLVPDPEADVEQSIREAVLIQPPCDDALAMGPTRGLAGEKNPDYLVAKRDLVW